MGSDKRIIVEVACILKNKPFLVCLSLPSGSSVLEAIKESGILSYFPTIDLADNPVGIFSKKVSLETKLLEGDRVEIYCPLPNSPEKLRLSRIKATKKN